MSVCFTVESSVPWQRTGQIVAQYSLNYYRHAHNFTYSVKYRGCRDEKSTKPVLGSETGTQGKDLNLKSQGRVPKGSST